MVNYFLRLDFFGVKSAPHLSQKLASTDTRALQLGHIASVVVAGLAAAFFLCELNNHMIIPISRAITREITIKKTEAETKNMLRIIINAKVPKNGSAHSKPALLMT